MVVMARKKKSDSGLIILLAAGAAIVFLGFKKNGGGNGAGPATPGGSLGTVEVNRGAAMGAHLVPKTHGEVIQAMITWTPATVNAAGQPIAWTYFFDFEIVERSTGIVRQSGGLGQANGTTGSLFNTFGVSLQVGFSGAYDFRLFLFGANSDPNGNPIVPSSGVLLDSETHLNAILAA